MALPNYSPSGTILLGCVPWDNSYRNVRLYGSVSEQHTDIARRMTISTSDYVYVARNRRLKISVHADRLYHINYCAFQNASLGSGWIYCFVTDVQYINDQTTELTIETDVFQTYLYGTDWTLPPCFIERKTVSTEAEKYMLTQEDDISLIYRVTDYYDKWFEPKAIVILATEAPQENTSLKEEVLNPQGYYAIPAPSVVWKGAPMGANYWVIPYAATGTATQDYITEFLEGITKAGAIESVVSIFTVPNVNYDLPSVFKAPYDGEWDEEGSFPAMFGSSESPDSYTDHQGVVAAPARGNRVDGYSPKNKKLLYWPYTYLELTDYNGSRYQYRYELFGESDGTPNLKFRMKYVVNPACEIMIYPESYQGRMWDMDFGIVTKCGAIGGWSNNQFQTWLGQHGVSLALDIGMTAVGFVAGAGLLAQGAKAARIGAAMEGTGAAAAGITGNAVAGNASRSVASSFAAESAAASAQGKMALGAAALSALNTAKQVSVMSKQPEVSKGVTDFSLMFQTGMQGFHLNRMQVKSELAEQIDEYFSMFGYNVSRVESINLNGRPYWDYIKTVGAAATSYNVASSASVPHSRGRGCPSDALAIINSALDGGCTFWHTTDHFGDYSQDNSIVW